MHTYEVRPRKDHRGVDLISDALPFGRLWYEQVTDAIEYAKHRSRSHRAMIRVYDEAGKVIETHEWGRLQRVVSGLFASGHARYQTAFSACSGRGLVAKTIATK
jgi:hypothetical protein